MILWFFCFNIILFLFRSVFSICIQITRLSLKCSLVLALCEHGLNIKIEKVQFYRSTDADHTFMTIVLYNSEDDSMIKL